MSVSAMPSTEQVEKLVEVLEVNRWLAMGHARTSHAREKSTKAWKDIARNLNGRGGCVKSWQQWSKYWRDKKGAVKKKIAARAQAMGKGDQNCVDLELSGLDERIVTIMRGHASKDFDYEVKAFNDTLASDADMSGRNSNSIHIQHTESLFLEEEPPPMELRPNLRRKSQMNVKYSPEPSGGDSDATYSSRDRSRTPLRKASRRRQRRSSTTERRNEMAELSVKCLALEEGRRETELVLARTQEMHAKTQELLARTQEIQARTQESLVQSLERVSQAWSHQSQATLEIAESIRKLIETLNK